MPQYRLTAAAEADLREIAQYTRKSWGDQQALNYAANLAKTFQSIADRTALSRNFSTQFPKVRVTRCEQHYVFYLDTEDKDVSILAVLHRRMDMLTRLAQRLPD